MVRKGNSHTKYQKFFLHIFLVVSLFLLQKEPLSAQCPRGAIDCIHACDLSTDTNSDGYCDYSSFSVKVQKYLKTKMDSVLVAQAVKQPDVQKVSVKDTIKPEKTEEPITRVREKAEKKAPVMKKEPGKTEVLIADNDSLAQASQVKPIIVPPHPPKPKPHIYNLLAVGIPCVLLYLVSWIISRRRRLITPATHRKIWNVILLATFLVSCILGLLLTIFINYNIQSGWFLKFLHWHVDFGIAMTLIAIFHVLWHLRYFLCLFKKANKNQTACQ